MEVEGGGVSGAQVDFQIKGLSHGARKPRHCGGMSPGTVGPRGSEPREAPFFADYEVKQQSRRTVFYGRTAEPHRTVRSVPWCTCSRLSLNSKQHAILYHHHRGESRRYGPSPTPRLRVGGRGPPGGIGWQYGPGGAARLRPSDQFE
eukprot:606967-Hanusia_phi.AAC.1